MKTAERMRESLLILVVGSLIMAGNGLAQETQQAPPGMHWEIWCAATNWSSVNDLSPQAGGSFDSVGFGVGGGTHWPVAASSKSELLLGVEAAVLSHDSDIPVEFDDLLARDAYVALSAQWMLGAARRFSLDTGYAYHLMDISQVEFDYYYFYSEFENWEESAGGFFVGLTWDTWAGKPGKNGGLSLGFKVHYVDFGTVRDEDIFLDPVLGPNAGTLDGPLYVLQIGYSSR